MVVNDDAGGQIQAGSLTLAPYGRTAFEFRSAYPSTAGKRGTIEFRPPSGGQISVLGLQFNPKGAFTTIRVWAH